MSNSHHSTSNTQEMWTAAVCWRVAFSMRTYWGASPSSPPVLVILGRLLLWPDTYRRDHAGIQAYGHVWNMHKKKRIHCIHLSTNLHYGFMEICYMHPKPQTRGPFSTWSTYVVFSFFCLIWWKNPRNMKEETFIALLKLVYLFSGTGHPVSTL